MSGEPAESKVVILFKQTGDAPILKQNKVKISGQDPFSKLVDFLRKKLGRDQVFVYLKEAFCPSLEERVQTLYDASGVDGLLDSLLVNSTTAPRFLRRIIRLGYPLQTLYDAFGVDGRLVVNYALTPAWG